MLPLKIYWSAKIALAGLRTDDEHCKHGDNSPAELAAFDRALTKDTPFKLA